MMKVRHHAQVYILVLLGAVLFATGDIAHGLGKNVPHADSEQQGVSSTTSVEELRQAIDELKTLIRAADDIQESIKKATVRNTRLLRRAHLELATSANRGDKPPPSFSEHSDWQPDSYALV